MLAIGPSQARPTHRLDRLYVRYVKILASLKHYTAYSVETNRGHDNANISAYDLTDSYLRQFEIGFVEGRASGVMCSYNLINGCVCARACMCLYRTDCFSISSFINLPVCMAFHIGP